MNGFYETGLPLNESMVPKSTLKRKLSTLDMNIVAALKQKSLQERWAEVTKRVELWVEIMELNDNGDYVNVDVIPCPATTLTVENKKRSSSFKGLNDMSTGGIYQLRQVFFNFF